MNVSDGLSYWILKPDLGKSSVVQQTQVVFAVQLPRAELQALGGGVKISEFKDRQLKERYSNGLVKKASIGTRNEKIQEKRSMER